MILALVAGAVGWGIIESIHPLFLVPEEFHITAMGAPLEDILKLQAATERTDRKNAIVYFALLGGLIAGGIILSQRSVLAVAIATPLGAVLGAAAGWGAHAGHLWRIPQGGQADMNETVAVHMIALACLGLAVGLACGAGRRSLSAAALAALGGLAAGCLAGMAFPIGMSFVMPAVNTTPLIPLEASSRLVWIALSAALLAVIVTVATQGRRRPRAAAAQ
jgi:hypothetical protein